MKTQIKGIALLLAVILTFSGLLVSSAASPVSDDILSAPPVTEPVTEPTTVPTTEPVTEPTTVPTTVPPTTPPEPTTVPTEPEPTAPAPVTPTTPALPEPWSSTDITIGSPVAGITAKKAFVYDCTSGTYFYMKSEADAKVYPASITKLMNAYTALQYLDASAVLTMGSDVLALVPYDTSKAALYAGDQLTAEMVLRAMLIPSGSDAAHLMAVTAGRVLSNDHTLPAQQAEDVFVEEMNRQAAALGLINTHFVNCDGYTDYYHYTCMADLATIATACLNTPLIRDTVCNYTATLTYTDGRSRLITGTNALLNPNSLYHRSDARGMKTGTTNAAGACLLSAFWTGERYLLVGVFQCNSNNQRYDNAVRLYDAYKDYYPPVVETQPPQTTVAPTTQPATPPTTPPTTPAESPLSAEKAFVYNCESRTYAFTKGDLNEKLYPASITKLFTAYVALQYLDPAQSITAGDILDTVPAYSSRIWLVKGNTLTAEQLVSGMLLCSGGDAARVLAAEAGRKIAGNTALPDAEAMAVFVDEMNRQATSLGMSNTHFVNPDGYHHDDHYSCMADLTLIGTLSLDIPLIRQICSTVSIPNPLDGTSLWQNTTSLLDPQNTTFYRGSAVGLKTGYTSKAGRCLLSAFLVNGEYVLVGVFGCPDPNSTLIPHFQDACYLYDNYLAP